MIVRHAKSSWDDLDQKDIDRPLNDRGNRDAPMMAKRLVKNKHKIDLLVSSPAKRAMATARYFAEELDIKKKKIIEEKALYEASVRNFYDVVSKLDDDEDTVALFSHNPGITDFANQLGNTRLDNMPTCSIFAVECDIKHWKDFKDAEKQFLFFDFPKNITK